MKAGMRNLILISTVILVAAGGIYNYFGATLSLSDITGKSNNSFVNFGLRLIDFDTGLTRYDVANLKKNQVTG
jgi:hypothetical protein